MDSPDRHMQESYLLMRNFHIRDYAGRIGAVHQKRTSPVRSATNNAQDSARPCSRR